MDQQRDLLGSSDHVLRTVVMGALAAVVVMDADGLVRGWGPQAVRMFGWSHSEAIGSELARLIVPPELREDHRRGLARYLDTRQPRVLGRVVEMEGITRAGDRIPVEISINPPVDYEGRPVFIAFLRDISERRSAEASQKRLYEEAQRSNQALRDFTHLVAHELRGPLAVVNGYASMLADEGLAASPAEERHALSELRMHAALANELVERLLMTASIDAGALKPQLEAIPLGELVDGVLSRAGARANLLGGTVRAVGTVHPGSVRADRAWTASILDNLVSNALIHSGDRPDVTIEAQASDPASVWVSDQGDGVPPEAADQIFERFYRGPAAKKPAGTGLGLYLSRELARLQGGELCLESAARGARFRLDLARQGGIAATMLEGLPSADGFGR